MCQIQNLNMSTFVDIATIANHSMATLTAHRLVITAWLIVALITLVASHGSLKDFPINPRLGVSGFPDCVRIHPEWSLDMVQASFDLDCPQRCV